MRLFIRAFVAKKELATNARINSSAPLNVFLSDLHVKPVPGTIQHDLNAELAEADARDRGVYFKCGLPILDMHFSLMRNLGIGEYRGHP